ncbi:MAG: pentapeptide repeat-containing protein [Immundisolibacteraceae bacterium]|nr:pentapeptide repeat-containing protein [Immundisolibacteraceae bacterium]
MHEHYVNEDLRDRSFRERDLRYAIMTNCNLENVDFSFSDLRYVDFTSSNLFGACFHGARLHHSIFNKADITEHEMKAITMVCPEKGSFKAHLIYEDALVEIEILEDSPRLTMYNSRYCRAKSVKVVNSYNMRGEDTKAPFLFEKKYYKTGDIIEVNLYNNDPRIHGMGIPFFITSGEVHELLLKR